MNAFVVDTNVAVVANASGQHPVECVAAAARALNGCREGVVVIDQGMHIFNEYRRYLSFRGQPGVGDAFLRWLCDNLGTVHCERVDLKTDETGNFTDFPSDPALEGFDRSDRKFVATARASRNSPVILNAVDSDWRGFAEPLARHGVQVKTLCAASERPSRRRGNTRV